jgi:hypothetical protein
MKILAASAALFLLGSLGSTAGEISPSHPDGLLCSMPATEDRREGKAVLYLSLVLNDDSVLYQSLGKSVISIAFDASGAAVDSENKVCSGLSLQELVVAGMTFG